MCLVLQYLRRDLIPQTICVPPNFPPIYSVLHIVHQLDSIQVQYLIK